MAPNGIDILKEEFTPQFGTGTQTLEQLTMKILEAHSKGIIFRELNAGPKIDE